MAECPFCGFYSNEYAVQLHIEQQHTEDSPFVSQTQEPVAPAAPVSEHNASRTSAEWTRCTREGCGELIPLAGIDEHLDLHMALDLSQEEDRPPLPPRLRPQTQAVAARPGSQPATQSPEDRKELIETSASKVSKAGSKSKSSTSAGKSRDGSLLSYFSGGSSHSTGRKPPTKFYKLLGPRTPGRLGKRELGPHAFEREMPAEVRRRLEEDTKPREVNRIGKNGKIVRERHVSNETTGLVPVLADLCAMEDTTTVAYLCHPSTKHIHKVKCDGDFCGYWSTQMVLSYVQHVNPDGPQTLPNVLKMQSYIEQAWDRGIGAHGRIETGGIYNTRKWIGTHEAVAFFTRIDVGVDALAFEQPKDRNGNTAVQELLDHVEAYFMSAIEFEEYGTSRVTQLPPIFFQRLGHSMAIVGIERKVDETRNLLVFDSSHATSETMKKLVATGRATASVRRLLDVYRRSDWSLSKWNEFEIIVPHVKDDKASPDPDPLI
ncbi:unnamed protein product [Zymoseptoria tritici ST99CH_3D1]|nr:unnamed protein product [Zymoseptoria tritici ST99CH_3D1]